MTTFNCALRNICGQHFASKIISHADNADAALDMSVTRAALKSSLSHIDVHQFQRAIAFDLSHFTRLQALYMAVHRRS